MNSNSDKPTPPWTDDKPKHPWTKPIRRMAEIVVEEMAAALKTRDARIRDLEARIAALESRISEFSYKGVWRPATVYRESNSVTDNGSLWFCRVPQSTQRPGDGSDWQLAVKRGRDGRNGRDARP